MTVSVAVVADLEQQGTHMSHELKTPVLLPIPGGKFFKLMEEFEVESIGGNYYRIPKDFITDLASVPAIFRVVFPRTGWYMVPAIVHDWVWINDRQSAAAAFEDMLLTYKPESKLGLLRKTQIRLMVIAVSFWAWFRST